MQQKMPNILHLPVPLQQDQSELFKLTGSLSGVYWLRDSMHQDPDSGVKGNWRLWEPLLQESPLCTRVPTGTSITVSSSSSEHHLVYASEAASQSLLTVWNQLGWEASILPNAVP